MPGLWLLVSFSLGAEEDPSEGHSVHGEVFNEGPRQEAVLLAGTGSVSFEVSTGVEEAQRFFNQGVGQLHGFWDFEAERTFRKVAALDPDCAMAYWGMAMANHENPERAKGFLTEALKRVDGVSAREGMWIGSLKAYYEGKVNGKTVDEKTRRSRYVDELEKIVKDYPKDAEAKAFLLLQIWRNSSKGIPIKDFESADRLAREVLKEQPNHPIHHYRIHLWDKKKPENALDSAALCGPAAPGIAHMWHMPGHIYSKLHRYGDAAWQQEASARLDHAHMMLYRIVPDKIHNFAHNNEWLIRNLNYVGRVEDAVELACNMIELPRLAKLAESTKEDSGDAEDAGDAEEYEDSKGCWSYGRKRLRDTLVRYRMWDRLLAFGASEYLKAGHDEIDEVEWNRFMGIAAFESGKAAAGEEHLAFLEMELEAERERQRQAKAAPGKGGSTASSPPVRSSGVGLKVAGKKSAAKENEENGLIKRVSTRANARDELKVCSLIFGSDPDLEEARKRLAGMKSIGEERRAWLMLAAEDAEAAVRLATEAVKSSPGEVEPLATQVAILWETGKKEEALAAFEKLRVLAADADEGLPVFERLAPLVATLGIEGNWRLAPEPADDLGVRPELASLGPFQWEPPVAPGWSLKDAEGKTVSLDDYRGRPVLVIFYLGKGCTHCMEQLNAFAPMQEKYAEAGIEIVAVSTDSPEGLKITYRISDDEAENPFPFSLLSDEGLGTFKEYRAYDDYEAMALHGTFLIDGEGKVRWQDIGFKPFMHPEFLLEESVRLLGFEEAKALRLSGR